MTESLLTRRLVLASAAPLPVVSNGKGKLYKNSSVKTWFAKIEEEVLEAHEVAVLMENSAATLYKGKLAEELTDVITVCVSYLHALGYDLEGRAKLYEMVNAKNRARGYFNAEGEQGDVGDKN